MKLCRFTGRLCESSFKNAFAPRSTRSRRTPADYQSASDVDSANNYSFSSDHDSGYSSGRFSDQSANECSQKLCRRSGSDISLPVTQFPNTFFPFKQAWRMIPGPPSLCVPFNPTSSPLGRLMLRTTKTGGAPASPQ